jgi:putative transposase
LQVVAFGAHFQFIHVTAAGFFFRRFHQSMTDTLPPVAAIHDQFVDLCRTHGISDATFYNWRTKYGGMEVSDAKRLKVLEDENKKLKQMLADSMLENKAIKDVLSKKW